MNSPVHTPIQSPARSNSNKNVVYSDRFIPSRFSTNLEDALELMENRSSGKYDQNSHSQTVIPENQSVLNTIIRSELLGQGPNDFYSSNRSSDSNTINSPSRKDSSSSNLFKYRSSSFNSTQSPRNSFESQVSINSMEFPISGGFGSNTQAGSQNTSFSSPKKPVRKISKTPYKVLDAPALQDDYYLNLVDWSHSNVLSVALGSSVYLWSACTSKVTRLCDLGDDTVTSISWALSGNHISIGTNSGKVQIWDTGTCKMSRELSGHESRVGTMAWNSTLLASGSRDRNILVQDIRIRGTYSSSSSISNSSGTFSNLNSSVNRNNSSQNRYSTGSIPPNSSNLFSSTEFSDNRRASLGVTNEIMNTIVDNNNNSLGYQGLRNNSSLSPRTNVFNPNNTTISNSNNTVPVSPCVVREFSAHKQEVCGLKWSFDEKMLASGGNDNKLFVWDSSQGTTTEPLCRFEDHNAAVKAVAWSPHQHGLLASGGGTADRHIRFWNASLNIPLHKIDTGSQVCNLMWSKNINEIVSTHGYSLNQVIVWKYPSMQKIATLTGHTLRVLYLAMSPDGCNIVTGAGDETLRFWNIFPGPKNKTGFRLGPSFLLPCGSEIR